MICQIHNIPCRLKNSVDQPFDGFMRMYQIVGLYIAQDIQAASKAIFCGDVNLGGMSLFFLSMDVFTESWLRLNGSKTWCWTFDLFNLYIYIKIRHVATFNVSVVSVSLLKHRYLWWTKPLISDVFCFNLFVQTLFKCVFVFARLLACLSLLVYMT